METASSCSTDLVRGRSGADGVAPDARALLGTARLLTGSDSAAADLVVRVLARRPTSPADAVARLLRVHLGHWSRLTRGTGSIDGSSTGSQAWWVSPADLADARRLGAALDRLTPPQRTVLVLSHHERLGTDAIAALVPGAATLLTQAHVTVADEVPDPAALLARLDGLVALTSGAGDLVSRAGALRSTRRRRFTVAAVAAAGLAAASVLVPADVDVRVHPPPATASATPTAAGAADATWVAEDTAVVLNGDGSVVTTTTGVAPGPLAPVDLDVLFGPGTRGSLAGDAALLAELLNRADRFTAAEDQATRSRVLFAGDIADQRVAVVATPELAGLTVVVFTGTQDTPADALEVTSTWVDPGAASVGLVVGKATLFLAVVRPGDTVEWSPGIVVSPEGVPGRSWVSTPVPDGVLVQPMEARGSSGLAYRVVRDGTTLDVTWALDVRTWSGGVTPDTSAPPPPLRPGRPAADQGAWLAALLDLMWGTGLTAEELSPSVLWAGTMPAPSGGRADVVVVAAVLPNGAVLVTTGYSWTASSAGGGGLGSSGSCGTSGHPTGTDPTTVVVAARCDVVSSVGETQLTDLVVTAPPGTRTVTLGAPDGGPTVDFRLTRGYTVVREVDPGLTLVTAPVAGPVTSAYPWFFEA